MFNINLVAMANIYQFSPSSLELVERCINAASQPGTKWIKLFNSDVKETLVKQESISFVHNENTVLLESDIESEIESEKQVSKGSELEVERIRAILEAEPSNKLEYLSEQCTEHLQLLADKISPHCIATICEELFNNLKNQYEKIVLSLFPVYIKQENSSVAANLLVKANNNYPDTIMGLIKTLFLNTDIPNKLLEEFFIAANEKTRSRFLKNISMSNVPTEVFIHHLNTINYLYKNSQKLSTTQSFILNGLLRSAEKCQENKNYGLCMLTFFQGLCENDVDICRQNLVTLLELHKTPFKMPCKSVLEKLDKSQQ